MIENFEQLLKECESYPDDYETYEKLVILKDNVIKEEEKIQARYFKEFGKYVEELFTIQLECIKLKKSITFCQAKQNNGQPINGSELDSYLDVELSEFYYELENIQELNKISFSKVSTVAIEQSKKIYKEIAKLIHPDIHPEQIFSAEISSLWEKTKEAYANYDVDELIEIKILVINELEASPIAPIEIDEYTLKSKINKIKNSIERIITNKPYLYKELLMDDGIIEKHKVQLKQEIDVSKEYLKSLQENFSEYNVQRWLS